mgnify:CR=1 FL=1
MTIKDGVYLQISAFGCGRDAGALPAAYALWVLWTGAAGGGRSICLVGIQILSEREDGDDGHIHCTGSALPTICESGFGTRNVESGGCCGGGIPCLDWAAREEDEQEISNTLYNGKEIDTYSRAYIFLEKGAGDNTGKAEDQQEDRDSYDQTGNREEDRWGYHQETLWEVDGGEGCCDAD